MKLIYIILLSFNSVYSLKLLEFKDKIKSEIDYNTYNLISNRLNKIKKDISNIKISPFYISKKKNFKSGYKISNYKFITQKRFLKNRFKNRSWDWWWKNNKLAFIILFPLYFKNRYNSYPPIYYDFFHAYGYYPEDQYFEFYLNKYMPLYKKNINLYQYKSKYKSECQSIEIGLDFFVDLFYKDLINL